MQERNQQNQQANKDRPDDMTNKGHSRQGVDKAPGEETPQDIDNVVYDSQKGKNKVDGDPSKESDQPLDI